MRFTDTELAKQSIKVLVAAEIPEGTSSRVKCPMCYGGNDNEKSLSVTHEAGRILYQCFRDSCRLKGAVILRGGGHRPEAAVSVERGYEYTGETVNPSELDYEYFKEKYDLDPEDFPHGVRRCLDDQRFLLPIRGPWGSMRGYVARSLFLTPKALNYVYRLREPFIGWVQPMIFHNANNRIQVLVEDWFSAVKVAKAGYWATSLNGTGISWAAAVEIAKECEDGEVVLALDPGALKTAMRHYTMYKGMWEKCRVVSLKRDLKYETEETIKNVITNREEGAVSSTRSAGVV